MTELILRSSEYSDASLEAALGLIFGTGSILVSMTPLVIAFIIFIIFAVSIVLIILEAIPYYVMSKRNGYKYPWIAFIPMGAMYLRFILSDRQYNLFDKYQTPNRNLAFIAYVIVNSAAPYINMLLTLVIFIPVIGSILSPFTSIVTYAVSLFSLIFVWRANYDLLITYGMEKHAMWISVVSCFIPVVMIVVTFIIMKRTPILGTDYNVAQNPAQY